MESIIEFDGEDRISNLPESLLEHIQSFLSLKQAAQTSILSKRWRELWHLCPDVEFDFTWEQLFSGYNGLERRRELFDYLERVLQYRIIEKIKMRRFTVCMVSVDFEFNSFINHCVFYAVLSGVKEFRFYIRVGSLDLYELPRMVLSAESLQVLELYECKLEPSTRNNVKLPSLRQLRLLCFAVDDNVINDLFAKSPSIEYISIDDCRYKNIKLPCPNLKSLLIRNCPYLDEVDIEAAKLSIFGYFGKTLTFHLNGLALTKCIFDFWNPKDLEPPMQAIWLAIHGSIPSDYEVLKIFNNVETAIVPRGRRNLPSPIHGVDHLDFTIQNRCENTSILDVLDGLLWISPHPKTISIRFRLFYRTFKFSYTHQLFYHGRETPPCCKSRPVHCWRHCMKQVEIKIGFRALGESLVKKRYLFEDDDDADIWERIRNLEDLDFE